jgi:catechol 2,3-dioxygenase-like lactoylglutathione lyase family enzyme
VKIVGADHTSFTISNLENSLSFYIDKLNLELLWKREIDDAYFCDIIGFPDCTVRAAHLRIPGSNHHIELFEYVLPGGKKADLRTNIIGSSHISLIVEDIWEAYEDLMSKEVQFRSKPIEITHGANQGGWGVYLIDPDGITVELFQLPRKST